MSNQKEELVAIVTKFAESGWDLIDAPSKKWLSESEAGVPSGEVVSELIKAVEQADVECGSCGCEFDPLYKKALEILRAA